MKRKTAACCTWTPVLGRCVVAGKWHVPAFQARRSGGMRVARTPGPETPIAGRSRAVISGLRPLVDGGRYPVKRILHEPVHVEADIFTDGHDRLRCTLLYQHERDAQPTRITMQ